MTGVLYCLGWKFFPRVISTIILIFFTLNTALPVGLARANGLAALNLPTPGTMVHPTPAYLPPLAIGMEVHPDNPFQFSFIIDKGDSGLAFDSDAFRQESEKLVKYFMASLTVPEKEQWVNLSPYEKNRITGEGLGQTDMGRDMLAQDYILKQLSASLFYPEDDLGQAFWQRVYSQANEQFGVTDLPLDTFNKVWIMPDKAVVYEKGNRVFVVEQHLKVMLESDYKSAQVAGVGRDGSVTRPEDELAKQVMREILIPAIEKEVNAGKNFATLRQIYNSMILAVWYKKTLRDSVLGKIYVDRNKAAGIQVDDPGIRQKLYDQYLAAFRAGVYNYIKDEVDPQSRASVPRKYVSGGAKGLSEKNLRQATTDEKKDWAGRVAQRSDASASVAVDFAEAPKTDNSEKRKSSASVARMMPGAKAMTNEATAAAVEAQAPGTVLFVPVASLPSVALTGQRDYGVGDLGPEARELIESLERAGAGWLREPLLGTNNNGDPYYGDGLFGLNGNLLSPQDMVAQGFITQEQHDTIVPNDIHSLRIAFDRLGYKEQLARQAYANFLKAQETGVWPTNGQPVAPFQQAFDTFVKDNTDGIITVDGVDMRMDWLRSYSLFQVLSRKYSQYGWLGLVDQYSVEHAGLEVEGVTDIWKYISEKLIYLDMADSLKLNEVQLKVSLDKLGDLQSILGDENWQKIRPVFEQALTRWPDELANINASGVKAFEAENRQEIGFFHFFQFLVRQQVEALNTFAQEHHVPIIEDLNIYPRFNSADCWGNPDVFIYDKEKRTFSLRTGVRNDIFGHVPPDLSKAEGINFYVKRFVYALRLAPGARFRLDYVFGYADPFVIPRDKPSHEGYFLRDVHDGLDPYLIFERLAKIFPEVDLTDVFIAENLGEGTPRTDAFFRKLPLPGMSVLQYMSLEPSWRNRFNGDPYHPANLLPSQMAFLASHDNPSTRLWDSNLSTNSKKVLAQILRELGVTEELTEDNIAEIMNKVLMNTMANTTVVNYADVVDGESGAVGIKSQHNVPGTSLSTNWSYRQTRDYLTGVVPRLKQWIKDSHRAPDNWMARREPVRRASPAAQLALAVLAQGSPQEQQMARLLTTMVGEGRVRKADLRQGMLSVLYRHSDGEDYIFLSRSDAARDGGYLAVPQQAQSLIAAVGQLIPEESAAAPVTQDTLASRLDKIFYATHIDYTRVVLDEDMREKKIMPFLGALVNFNLLESELDADTVSRLKKAGLWDFRVYYTEKYRPLWDRLFAENQSRMSRPDLVAGLLNGTLPLINKGQLADLVAAISEAFGDEIAPKTGKSAGDALAGTSADAAASPGGVTLDTATMDFRICRDSHGVPLPVSAQPWAQLDVSGFEPRIGKIVPVSVAALVR